MGTRLSDNVGKWSRRKRNKGKKAYQDSVQSGFPRVKYGPSELPWASMGPQDSWGPTNTWAGPIYSKFKNNKLNL